MVEKCARCTVSGEKVRLFDAIYDGKSAMICERCSIIENIPLIKKPNTKQLKESEKSIDVYERMKRMSGYKEPKKQDSFFKEDRLKELEKNPRLELPEYEQLNLIDHFHWEIMKNRRRKGLSHRQLAETIGESEIAIEMLERGKIPENADVLIRKLEQFFQVSLRRITAAEEMILRKARIERTKPVLLDEYGNELDKIPEPEIQLDESEEELLEEKTPKKIIVTNFERKNILGEDFDIERPWRRGNAIEKKQEPKPQFLSPYLGRLRSVEQTSKNLKTPEKELAQKPGDFDIRNTDLTKVTVKELKEMHRMKLDVSKQERIEEQKRIEEKQRLIEARKEEFRLIKEKESRKIDDVLGGAELLGKKKISSDSLNKFDEELI